jgi:cobalt-zinc-cadmium efflux system protein
MQAKKIFWIILFNLVIIAAEVVFGLLSNSFALIADALHNTADVMAICITYIALVLGTRKTTFRYTFGFIKAEMMAAFINSLFLFLAMFVMIYHAIDKLLHPETIEPLYMISVGLVAVVANGVSAYLLHKIGVEHHHHDHDHEHHHHHEDANIKSAYLHMLSDALISVGVVVAGIFIYFFQIYSIDSILTVVFSLYILKHTYPLLTKSFYALMDINASQITLDELHEIIKADSRVLEFHDLHLSQPSSKHEFISFHIVLEDSSLTLEAIEKITKEIERKLHAKGFDHILIQVDSKAHAKENIGCVL